MLKNKKLLWGLIAIMILAQIYVPASMIWSNEQVLTEGKMMKFQIAPIDPNDPFRGKFIILDFLHSSVENTGYEEWENGEVTYAILDTDSLGYVFPSYLSKIKPDDYLDYIEMEIDYVGSTEIWLNYPFDKFYMEESKAPIAEEIYFNMVWENTHQVYAVVYVKEGKAILEDVEIDGVPIADLVDIYLEQ